MEQEKNPAHPQVVAPEEDWDYRFTVPTSWNIRGRNPTMRLLNDEQIEALASSGNPLPQNFFFFTAGIAAALVIQLESGVVDIASRNYLWIAFFVMAILSLFFGSLAVYDYLKSRRVKQLIRKQSPTAQAEAPTLRTKAP